MYLNLLKISICCVLDLFWKVSLRLRIRPKNRKALQLRAFWAGGFPLAAAVLPQAGPQEGGVPAQVSTPRGRLSGSRVYAPWPAARFKCPHSAAGCPAQAPALRGRLPGSGVHAPQLRIRHVLPRDLRELLQILL